LPERSWAAVVADRFESGHIDALLREEAAFILIRGLLSADWCAEISRRFVEFIDANPEHHVWMRTNFVDTVVMPMNMFMRPDDGSAPPDMASYFARVEHDRSRLRDMYAGGADPYDLVSAFWRDTGWTGLPAMEDGRRYHTDTLWGITSPAFAPPHVDTYHQETPCSLSRFPRRFSCNTFIQKPEGGGNFRVYRLRQKDGDFRREAPPPCAEYEIEAGDLLIFDAGHYHDVRPVAGDRHRLFSHMAVLLDPDTREYSIIA
jgi:hypothetical protein